MLIFRNACKRVSRSVDSAGFRAFLKVGAFVGVMVMVLEASAGMLRCHEFEEVESRGWQRLTFASGWEAGKRGLKQGAVFAYLGSSEWDYFQEHPESRCRFPPGYSELAYATIWAICGEIFLVYFAVIFFFFGIFLCTNLTLLTCSAFCTDLDTSGPSGPTAADATVETELLEDLEESGDEEEGNLQPAA